MITTADYYISILMYLWYNRETSLMIQQYQYSKETLKIQNME